MCWHSPLAHGQTGICLAAFFPSSTIHLSPGSQPAASVSLELGLYVLERRGSSLGPEGTKKTEKQEATW